MNHLRTALCLLASPAEKQNELLPGIPFDRGTADYYSGLKHNPLPLLLRGVTREHSQAESESDSQYLARTELRSGAQCPVLSELCCYLDLLLRDYHSDDYWNQRALADKTEWSLLRRLSALTLTALGWEMTCTQQDIRETLIHFRKALAAA